MYYHKVSSDMQVGAELNHTTGKDVGLAFGCMYKLDKDTTVKAKVMQSKQVIPYNLGMVSMRRQCLDCLGRRRWNDVCELQAKDLSSHHNDFGCSSGHGQLVGEQA